MLGVDAGKDALYARLAIETPGPGFIHFPSDDAFGDSYFAMLTAERREVRKRFGQPYVLWVLPDGRRNEALDTFVGALAVRRSLPRWQQAGLSFAVDDGSESGGVSPADGGSGPPQDGHSSLPAAPDAFQREPIRHSSLDQGGGGWMARRGGRSWMDRS